MANVKLQLNATDKILLQRNLSKNGKGQRFFTHEVRRALDAYVPMRSGVLKNTAVESDSSITYDTPYARKQYYENHGNGLRGKEWDKRMWPDRGPEIVRATAKFCGGKPK